MARPANTAPPANATPPASTEPAAPDENPNWDEAAEAEPTVRVRCIVKSRPHTGGHIPDDPKTHRGLYDGEEVVIPVSIAELMLAKKQVEKVA